MHACTRAHSLQSMEAMQGIRWQQTCSSKATQDCEGASSSPSHLLPLKSQILHCRSCSRVETGLGHARQCLATQACMRCFCESGTAVECWMDY